jgi:hypothetical protein
MDWILVLHFDAFQRIQDMAFTESRKLLTADASIEKFIHERVVITKDSVRPNECYAISHDVVKAPLDAPKWKTAAVAYDHAVIRVWQANALEKYVPNSIAKMEQFADLATGQTERTTTTTTIDGGVVIVRPGDSELQKDNLQRGMGRPGLVKVFATAKDNDLTVHLTHDGDLYLICDQKGNAVPVDTGIGKYLADLIASANNRTDGSGIDTSPGNKVVISRIWPVGSQLREEAGALKAAVEHYRAQVDGNDHEATSVNGMWQGSHVTYHYPPYNSLVRGKLNPYLYNAAADLGIVLMFYRNNSADKLQFILCTDREGVEISTTQGVGNEIAKAFGGVCGQPVRK